MVDFLCFVILCLILYGVYKEMEKMGYRIKIEKDGVSHDLINLINSNYSLSDVSISGSKNKNKLVINDQEIEVTGNDVSIEDDTLSVNKVIILSGLKDVETIKWLGETCYLRCTKNVTCENVKGDVSADGNATCGNVTGDVSADKNVTCLAVGGDVSAEGNVTCLAVGGDVDADGNVSCGGVSGDVNADGSVKCNNVGGDVTADGDVQCDHVEGSVSAEGGIKINK